MAKPKFSTPSIKRVGTGPIAAAECSCLCQCGSKAGTGSGGGSSKLLAGVRDPDREEER
jgi:hypothetical protein